MAKWDEKPLSKADHAFMQGVLALLDRTTMEWTNPRSVNLLRRLKVAIDDRALVRMGIKSPPRSTIDRALQFLEMKERQRRANDV